MKAPKVYIRRFLKKLRFKLTEGCLTPLFLLFSIGSLGSYAIAPIWPIYVRSLGASMVELGLIFSISNAVAGLLQAPSGFLADRFGKKPLIVAGVVIGSMPPLLYTYAQGWMDLIPWVILSGFASGVGTSARWAIVADMAKGGSLASAYGYMNIAWLSGSILGPLIGGLLADAFDLKTPFYLCFIFSVACIPISFKIKEARKEDPSVKDFGGFDEENLTPMSLRSVIFTFTLLNLIPGIGWGILIPITPVYLVARFSVSMTELGLLFTIGFGLASAFTQVPGGKISDKFGYKLIFMLTSILPAPIYILYTLTQNPLQFLLAMATANVITSLGWPAASALPMKLTPPLKRGLVTGVMFTAWWIGVMAGNALGGYLWDSFGMDFPFYIASSSFIIPLPLYLLIKEPKRR